LTESLNATKFGNRCVQNRLFGSRKFDDVSEESEDCLTLNVFAPAWENDHTFPVMFWIHGGGFNFGASVEFGDIGIADHLVAKGVVVVTFNYRLGPFGEPFGAQND
jgi:carboxylesterase type B